MHFSQSDKKVPIIKLVIALSVALISILITRISFIYTLNFVLIALSIACFSLVVYYIGFLSLIPATLMLVLIFLLEDLLSALGVLMFFIPAFAAGFALKTKKKPISVILFISIAYLVAQIFLYVLTVLVAEGSFSFINELKAISSSINESIATFTERLADITGNNFIGIESLIKAITVGAFISAITTISCSIYFATALIFRLFDAEKSICNGSLFNVIPSRLTAIVYIICLLVIPFSRISPDKIRYYSMLAHNLLLILTPVLLYSGLYYIFTIKFKKENASPFMLIITFLAAFFGAYLIFIFYLSLSGVTYSLKYSNINKIEEAKYDKKE